MRLSSKVKAIVLLFACSGCRDAEPLPEPLNHLDSDHNSTVDTDLASPEQANSRDQSYSRALGEVPLSVQFRNGDVPLNEKTYEGLRDEMSSGFPLTAGMSLERAKAIMESDDVIVSKERMIKFYFHEDKEESGLIWAHVVRIEPSSGA